MFDFNVFKGFSGAHWVVFNCTSGETLATGWAETVEAARDEASFVCAGRVVALELEALMKAA